MSHQRQKTIQSMNAECVKRNDKAVISRAKFHYLNLYLYWCHVFCETQYSRRDIYLFAGRLCVDKYDGKYISAVERKDY